MVRVENPQSGQREMVDGTRAQRLIAEGKAVSTVTSGGFVLQIRLIEALTFEQQRARQRLATGRHYDSLNQSFAEQLPGVPVVQASKMIRMEKSERDWSYAKSVRRTVRRDHSEQEVQAMRAMR